MKTLEKVSKVIENFLAIMYFGFEIEIKICGDCYSLRPSIQRELNDLFGNIFYVGNDAEGIEIKFCNKQRIEDGIQKVEQLFSYLQNSRFYIDPDVGIHMHFSHEGIDVDKAYDACVNRIKTYEDILYRIGSRTRRNDVMVNRFKTGNPFNTPFSQLCRRVDKFDRNMIRACDSKETVEFRFIDVSKEIWRIKSLIDFISRFYAYSITHKVNARTNNDNINSYEKGEYEYFKLYTFMNQNLQMSKEDIHNIITLYNDTFKKEDRVHKTKKQRREEVKAKAERQKARSW